MLVELYIDVFLAVPLVRSSRRNLTEVRRTIAAGVGRIEAIASLIFGAAFRLWQTIASVLPSA